MSLNVDRKQYANILGPTAGDKIRLGDTEIIIEIEKDFTHYGDEAVFGGGKTVRDGMGQNVTAKEMKAFLTFVSPEQ
jgi:urease subunit alpha